MKSNRLKLLRALVLQFIILSTLVRLSLYVWSLSSIDFSLFGLIRVMGSGLFFDIGTISFFTLVYAVYLIVFPKQWVGNMFDRAFSYFYYFFTTFILVFSFFAEFTFWEEFQNRFNFIAVDYLIYTNEVVENINQSYPIPFLFAIVLSIIAILFFVVRKQKVFSMVFSSAITMKQRAIVLVFILIPTLFAFNIDNNDAEWSTNRFENELSKTGIYSFFAAFRNNELDYATFYASQDIDSTFKTVKESVRTINDTLPSPEIHSIKRAIKSDKEEAKPNVIFVCIESLSASFMTHYGNENKITPTLDSLLDHSIYFENLFANGTRTVRGMEAITLSVPPTPGRSIVKRKNNANLHNIGDVFEDKGYSRTFFYGGDGYFDNMNDFFGGNGFDIVDRGRGYLFGDSFTAKRTNIEDSEVRFENAWGVSDEDIYAKVIKEADLSHEQNRPFFNFVMTTSNHRPYTYPENTIDIPSGTGRKGAVKYSDYAIGKFIEEAKGKPWFKNTVFVFMADHCASSAGKWVLNVAKYRIPAIIYNMPNAENKQINTQCSQIDLFPTLFGYLNWSYESHFFGRDVNAIEAGDERAFIGNYRKLGLLKGNKLTVLSEQKQVSSFEWNKTDNELKPVSLDPALKEEAISYYQAADYMYQNGLLRK